jgi:hypothetical protein
MKMTAPPWLGALGSDAVYGSEDGERGPTVRACPRALKCSTIAFSTAHRSCMALLYTGAARDPFLQFSRRVDVGLPREV